MTDLRFHDRSGPYSLARISSASECVLADLTHSERIITDVAPLDAAGPNDLSFLDNPKYKEQFRVSKAGACIVSRDMAAEAPKGMMVLVSDTPYRSYAMAATLFYPQLPPSPGISKLASIDPSAIIGEGCTVEPFAVIGRGVTLGKDCWIGAHATLSHCMLGERVRVHTGARIGQDGFGFALGPEGPMPLPQLGRVVIGDFVNIGANTTIDRGAGPDTVIGMGTVIDNLVQIAHNVRIGRGCVITAQVGISGSTTLEDFVVMGGQSGAAGHLAIGTGARIGAKSGVTKNVPAGADWIGFPARPGQQYWREQASIKKLLSNNVSKGKPDSDD